MYIIDLKDWMSNKGKYGYQKWANKKENKVNDDKKNVIVTMYLNAVTKTYDGGRNNYHAKGLNTKEKWKNATQHMRMAGYPEEYDQHYNIPVEFKFQVDDKQTPSHLIIESRVANGSTTYAKTYTNSQFQWAGSNVVGATKKMNESFGGYYHDSQLNFKIHPYEEYDKSNKKVYEDHLVFIWERAVEPKLSMNTELVSYDSDSGKYEGTTSGDYALDVPMNKMSDDYNVASTMDTLGKLVPSNNNLTLESFLKGKIKGLIKTGDKYDVGYYYNRLLYSTGDAVPAILSDIRVSYTDNNGTKIVKSRTD